MIPKQRLERSNNFFASASLSWLLNQNVYCLIESYTHYFCSPMLSIFPLYVLLWAYLLASPSFLGIGSKMVSPSPYGGAIVTWSLLAGPIFQSCYVSFTHIVETPWFSTHWDVSEFRGIFRRLNVRYILKLISCVWKNPGAGGVQTTFRRVENFWSAGSIV